MAAASTGPPVSTPDLYPVSVTGRLDAPLSRWLWLVKWVLAIPHAFLLVFLWAGFFVCSVVAFFAILITGGYPRPLFDFNVGVLRWSWRVSYYAFGPLATDRYPPFTLADVPDYPARFEVAYPAQLSRGLVLVKWWLLAIPQYFVIGVFLGGSSYVVTRSKEVVYTGGQPGLISVLVIIAVVALLFTGRYPRTLFDLVLGLNRWVLRVAAYAALMTDRYPPFRLDMGGDDPNAGPTMVTSPPAAPGSSSTPLVPPTATGPYGAAVPGAPAAPGPRRRSGGQIALIVLGALFSILAVPTLVAGGVALWADQTQRDADGFLQSPWDRHSSGGYALTTEGFDISADGPDWFFERVLGSVRVTARSLDGQPLFVGIAAEEDLDDFLAGVPHDNFDDRRLAPGRDDGGSRAPDEPAGQDFWVASAESVDPVVTWDVEDGNWALVVMNADADRGVRADVRVGAEVGWLDEAATAALVVGGLLLVGGAGAIYLGMRRR